MARGLVGAVHAVLNVFQWRRAAPAVLCPRRPAAFFSNNLPTPACAAAPCRSAGRGAAPQGETSQGQFPAQHATPRVHVAAVASVQCGWAVGAIWLIRAACSCSCELGSLCCCLFVWSHLRHCQLCPAGSRPPTCCRRITPGGPHLAARLQPHVSLHSHPPLTFNLLSLRVLPCATRSQHG